MAYAGTYSQKKRRHLIPHHVYHLMRGQVYKLNGKTFFTMGGTTSIDQAYRKKNISWWAQEEISQCDIDEAERNLRRVNYQVNYIITHTVANTFKQNVLAAYKQIVPMNSAVEDYLDGIMNSVKSDYWLNGHYHIGNGYYEYPH